MGDSEEESGFWDGKEDGYDGSFMSESFLRNQRFQPGNESIYVGESGGSKRIRLSPESAHQEADADSSSQSSPLGLTLRKTPSFLSLLQRSLSKGKHSSFSKQDNHGKSRTKIDDLGSHQSMSEKLKASNFPAVSIKIGSWQRFSRNEGDLTAKLYYAKRKLVWEMLDGALKCKIEVQWSDIIAIRALTPDNELGILEIELNQPPLFYREINPQPRKHTLWQQSSDFTGGQAPIWRRHCVTFQPGILDKHYEKLLQSDERLHGLSQKPFPSHQSPYFNPNMFTISELPFGLNRYGPSYYPGVQYPYQTYPTTARGPPLLPSPNPSISVMNLPYANVEGINNQFGTPNNQGYHVAAQDYYQAPNTGILNDIKNHLFWEPHAEVGTLHPLLVATHASSSNQASHPGTGCQYADQMMQLDGGNVNPGDIDGVYSYNWMPPLETGENIVAGQGMSSSFSPFLFPGNAGESNQCWKGKHSKQWKKYE